MIPFSTKEHVTYTDEDGIVWKFRPKTGGNERLLFSMYESSKELSLIGQVDEIDKFIDSILIGWTDKQNRMPEFTVNPSRYFNQAEKGIIIEYWNKANSLTVNEKKVS